MESRGPFVSVVWVFETLLAAWLLANLDSTLQTQTLYGKLFTHCVRIPLVGTRGSFCNLSLLRPVPHVREGTLHN